jgi:hypothetical protein
MILGILRALCFFASLRDALYLLAAALLRRVFRVSVVK